MYRQIKVDARDQDYQRILWRESPDQRIAEYKLTTVTYGTASAPFLAIRTLQQLAKDDEHKYPAASRIILQDTYVDDIVSGGSSSEEVYDSCQQLIKLLKGGGFNLHKWSSNDRKLLKSIPSDLRSPGSSTLDFDQEKTIKALGVLWKPTTDKFKIIARIDPESSPTTKRNILSEAARIFDPIGLLVPVVITIKLLIQEIWAHGSTWDDNLPAYILNRWKQIKEELPTLERIEIPRWINYTGLDCKCELHGFSDASEKAYSAVVYLRTIRNDRISINLLTAKTKVAPLKSKLSLARLELCGAVLLANLLKEAISSLEISNVQHFAWTDSMIVLAWLQEDAHKWKTFVGNRVAEIHSNIDRTRWYYVKSSDNPADVTSRGILPSKLRNHTLWWEGPSWLKHEKISYSSELVNRTDIEKRNITSHVTMQTEQPQDELIQRYSSLKKLQRVFAYCMRFINNARVTKEKRVKEKTLSVEEIESALIPIIKITQNQQFKEEITSLAQGREISKKSRISALSPFLDENRILRVGGRLEKADMPFNRKHPIILPYKSQLTTLVIDKMHKTTLHGGNSLTQEAIRQKFWILNGLKAVKGYIHQCVKCHRYKAQMCEQMMGILPKARVLSTPPFTHTGVDYAGPFDLLLARGRGNKTHKGYISIFICLTTKAIHIEVVTELTSQAFIAAFRRLVGRRGPVAHLYSGNATNFVGASKIIENLHKQDAYTKDVNLALQDIGTQWHFIPPSSPHFGGLWEAGVKSIKHHMRRVIGETKLTYEEMCTLMAQIEACLNSRPLCPLSEDPESLDVLTPGHFLTGSMLLTIPARNLMEDNPNLLDKWHRIERMHQQFWRRWSTEYLARLQQRPKWTQRKPNLEIGNLVLIKDEQLPPSRWALGRVIETHPGPDGLTRVVTLKTRGATLKRPVTKVSLLPIIDNKKELLDAPFNTEGETVSNEKLNNNASTSTSHRMSENNRSKSTKKNERKRSPEDHMRTEHERPKRKPQPTSVSSGNQGYSGKQLLYFMILTFFLLVAMGEKIDTPYKLTRFQQQEGLYFEDISEIQLFSSEWNLIIYYDLTAYWKEFIGIRKAIRKLTTICEEDGRNGLSTEICNATVLQLKHQLSESEHINEILYQQNGNTQSRSKRAPLEIVGSIANKLFGILDQGFAERYEEQIREIKQNENLLRELLTNQTSIAENTINVIKKNSDTVNHQLDLFEAHIQAITNNVNHAEREIKTSQAFTEAVVLITLSLINFQHVQKSILSVVTDTKQGRMNTLLLTPAQLNEQLTIIREHLPRHLRVPGDGSATSFLAIYNSIHVKMRITQNNVLFDVRIPLLSTETYRLYKIISVPTLHNGTHIYIQPSTPYLAVNLHRERFSPFTSEELKECTQLNNNQLICNLKHPIYSLRANQSRCEMDLLNHRREISPFCQLRSKTTAKVWIKLHQPSSWIFAMDEETDLDVICEQATYPISLNGSGIIQLQANCMIKHQHLIY